MLADLPWSTDQLFAALRASCAEAGASIAVLPSLRDVDTIEDLVALGTDLDGDARPARRLLRGWLATHADLAPR